MQAPPPPQLGPSWPEVRDRKGRSGAGAKPGFRNPCEIQGHSHPLPPAAPATTCPRKRGWGSPCAQGLPPTTHALTYMIQSHSHKHTTQETLAHVPDHAMSVDAPSLYLGPSRPSPNTSLLPLPPHPLQPPSQSFSFHSPRTQAWLSSAEASPAQPSPRQLLSSCLSVFSVAL